MRLSRLMAGALALAAVVAAPMVARSARGSTPVALPQHPSADDTASLSRLLAAVRGASPLFCELASRSVDGRGWWSSGPEGLLTTDSASAALIRWVRREHGDPSLVPRLAAGVRDPDACVRRVSGAMLGRVAHATAVAALLTALGDANADTRAVAALGLGLGEHRTAVQPLVQRLRDSSADVRRTAAWALGAIEDRSAMEALIELLGRDTDARVRQAAAWAIGQVTG